MEYETLGKVAEIIMGQSPPGEMTNTDGYGLPLLNGPTEFGAHHPLPVQYTTEARKVASPGDLLFCVRGSTTGRMNWADRKYAIGRGIAAIRHRSSYELQPLVRAVIEYQLPELLNRATGSTFPNVSVSQLAELLYPTLDEAQQREIAHILGTLDDKIELNRRMNATLEAIARAIFKSWFVDFDPVHAKARGEQPYGMDADTAALFPDTFEDSELGPIPAGWGIGALDTIAHFQNGLALQKYPPEDDEYLPVIKIRELRQGYSDNKSDKASPNIKEECILYDGDVVFSWSGSLLVDIWCGGKAALNQHLFKVTSETYPKWFYYYWTLHHLDEFQRIAADKATTMGHIKRGHLSAAKLPIPPRDLLERADEVIAPYLETQVINRLQARTLSELRDALLPKLISGQIRIPKDERTYSFSIW